MSDGQAADASADGPAFESLLEYIRDTRGFDFTTYKRSTLGRRIRRRMSEVGVETFAAYQDLLEVDVDEFGALFNTVLINVTSFFRDEAAWQFVANDVIPRILDVRRDADPIRIWSAGCASGEEAYTLTMLFAEALGADACQHRVKIYATDVDEEALATGRHATFREKELEPVPEAYRARYFEHVDNHYVVRNGFRRVVIFGRHDLIADAPIGRLDLLVCRNTLMYFNAETQAKILQRFHFGLAPHGYLFLGRAEMLLAQSQLFAPVSMRHRVFAKVGSYVQREPALSWQSPLLDEATTSRSALVRELAFETTGLAVLAVDVDGVLVAANNEARAIFGITSRDLGRLFHDLQISYRPVELRSRIEQAYSERRTVHMRNVAREFPDGETQLFDVAVTPLAGGDGTAVGVGISFADVTGIARLRNDLKQSTQDLETAYEELQSTNEELETMNEELQSSNEELETTNEELQSSNEELETTNEELRSANEQLEAFNEALRSQSGELDQTTALLGAMLDHLDVAAVVVDGDRVVRMWSQRAEDFLGKPAEQAVGSSVDEVGDALAGDVIDRPLRRCLAGTDGEKAEIEHGGRRLRVDFTPLGSDGNLVGVLLLVEPLAGRDD